MVGGTGDAQAVTKSAGRGIALSIFARVSSSAHLLLSINDGIIGVLCWFNLQAGTIGTHTPAPALCGSPSRISKRVVAGYIAAP